jgi:hypothetical protein
MGAGYRGVLVTVLLLYTLLAAGVAMAAKRGEVELHVVDSKTNEPIAVRMHLKDARGRAVKPPQSVYWHDHFVVDGSLKLELPTGDYSFEMERGPEYKIRTGTFTIEDDANDSKQLDMERFIDMAAEGWYSGDLAIHRSPADIELLMRADDLHIAPVVTWSSKRVAKSHEAQPITFDNNRIYQLLAGRDPRETAGLLLFGLPAPLDFSGHAPEYPSSVEVLQTAKETPNVYAVAERATCWDLPAWIATGQLDAVMIAHADLQRPAATGSQPSARPRTAKPPAVKESPGKLRDSIRYAPPLGVGRWSQDIYYQLLECGLRIAPAAGSGSGLSPNPVGYNRVYVHCAGEFTGEKWWQGLKQGRVVVSNGPVMQPNANGQLPGHVFEAPRGETVELSLALNLSTREKIDYLEVVQNGKVVHEVRLDKWAEANGMLPPVRFTESGWLLVRGVTNNGQTYRYATSGPFYVQIGYEPRISKKAAQFFYDWTFERAKQIKLADPAQHQEVIACHRTARDYWQALLEKANAD